MSTRLITLYRGALPSDAIQKRFASINTPRKISIKMSTTGGKQKFGSRHPYLAGNFAPVIKNHTPTPCSYTGRIPFELFGGQYIRNGGNPVTNSDLGRDAHWFDGDGMLSGVLFKRSPSDPHNITPHFVNQLILTDVSISAFQNRLLQTPILPSIATLVNPLASVFLIILKIFRSVFLVLISHLSKSMFSVKRISVANTSILYHDGRALATCESGPPIRVQLPGLETVGWFDGIRVEGETSSEETHSDQETIGGTGLLSWMKEWTTGHPKVDLRSGEMLLFHCNFVAPYVHYSVLPSEKSQNTNTGLSRIVNAPVPGCSGGKMMHDFGVSLQHTVILDLPLTLTPFNMIKNQPIVSYNPENPSRFGVFPRYHPDRIKWFETDGCCIFHTANTWDEHDGNGAATAVSMLACRLTSASLVFSAGNLAPPSKNIDDENSTRRRLSLFNKNGRNRRDSSMADLEKHNSNEQTPLLAEPNPFNTSSSTRPPAPPISDDDEQCRLYYYRFSLTSSTPEVSEQFALSTIPFEFPTLNPAYEMSLARYIYGCSTSNASFGAALGKATKIDVIVKMDVQTLLSRAQEIPPDSVTGCVDARPISQILHDSPPPRWDPALTANTTKAKEDESISNNPIKAFRMPPLWYAQEPRFVSRANAESEDDGFLLFYAFDESQLDSHGECNADAISELWVLDAKNMRDIVARVQLPQRVPYGLHGGWFDERMIEDQRGVEKIRTIPEIVAGSESTWDRVRNRALRFLR